ncbi:bifunctional FAD-dependent glycerol-3-phosphate dehydrogenase/Alpha-glycerophosphate oxidase [Babesia duncani]|uniref:glycerol-3-phosphate dehydrogenase n=1 Tax=Babesia duncani TaxID=323732 RepID=A0AAD9PJB6_9APIC|nr:bifunctional FAD-dependent glycerol-3-phosphate dehydrogenase/Alpha-glycerophosphate oxidase [Babesia duncani]
MAKRYLVTFVGVSSAAVGATYFSVRRQHEKSSIPKDTKYYYPPALPSRNSMLERLRNEEFDVLVIGGGCTGSAVALDCATRGLKCALVEAQDFASGTSSKSTKLLHGGIRYLESAILHLDFAELRFVWKALEERAHFMNALPFASSPLPIVLPLYKTWQVPYFWFNIRMYEMLAKFFCCNETGLPSSYYTSKVNAIDAFPALRHEGLLGAVVYYDGQHNDSRTNLLMALSSCIDGYVPGQVGAAVCNYVKVKGLIKDNTGAVCGAHVFDDVSNSEFKIRAKTVVNCAGPFSEEVRRLGTTNSKASVLHSRGTHIVMPPRYTPTQYGMVIPKTTDGRVLFILPWEGASLFGTTDDKDDLQWNPKPSRKDLDFICKDAALYLNVDHKHLQNDITSVWSGLRPLLKGFGDENTDKLSRGHVIKVDDSGLVNVFGGKWTICRLMAEECVDKLLKHHGDKLKPSSLCRTRNLQLYGTHDEDGVFAPQALQPKFNSLSRELLNINPKLSFDQANHLVASYGHKSKEIARMAKNDETLAEPIHPKFPYIMAEIAYGMDQELACTPLDILARRTRIAFIDSKAAMDVLGKVSDFMSKHLAWSAAHKQKLNDEATAYFKVMSASEYLN